MRPPGGASASRRAVRVGPPAGTFHAAGCVLLQPGAFDAVGDHNPVPARAGRPRPEENAPARVECPRPGPAPSRDSHSGRSDGGRALSVLDAVAVLVEVVALIIDGAEVHPAIGDLLGEVLPGHDANFASAFLELLITH